MLTSLSIGVGAGLLLEVIGMVSTGSKVVGAVVKGVRKVQGIRESTRPGTPKDRAGD